MEVLNLGKLELVDSMGSDLSVVQAARISNGAAMPDWRGAPDERLINFLAKHEHMTPFEHATFKFYVKAPIFVIREWQRHRTFSYNELSARYKKLEPEFFYPRRPRIQDPINKQGSVETDDDLLHLQVNEVLGRGYAGSMQAYEKMLDMGIAREIARSVLPVGIYSEMYVTGNFRNWMHWWWLRSGADAQQEIREYAHAVGDILAEKMPISFMALYNVRRGNIPSESDT
jgi:thymidylate synthase (FAD)